MRLLKILTLLGTIPELVRLSACIRSFDRYFEHVFVHTGQEKFYRHFKNFFDDMEVRQPDHFLGVTHHGMEQTAGTLLTESYRILEQHRPDALVILGDGIAALAAVSARQLGIPVFHLEAGNRSIHPDPLEDVCMKSTEALSDFHLAYTGNHRHNLISSGISEAQIFVTGSPMREVLGRHQEKIIRSTILERMGLEQERYILLCAYRDTFAQNEHRMGLLAGVANRMAETCSMQVVYTTNPDIWTRMQERGIKLDPRVRMLHGFGYYDLVRLHRNAWCVLSDSRTLPEEVSMFNFPAVLLRDRMERTDALDKGSVLLGGETEDDILRACALARSMWENGELTALHPDYYDINVSAKVTGIIQSCVTVSPSGANP